MQAKYLAASRKRKREKEEKEVRVSPRPAVTVTNAERMKQYRLRKKLAQETAGVCNDPDASADTDAVVNAEPIAHHIPDPIPGRSTDPVVFVSVSIEDISQDVALSFQGK